MIELLITSECKEISNDIISDIIEVGTSVRIKLVKEIDEVSDERDKYSKFYGQTKNDTPEFESTYDLHAILTYNPTEDDLKSAGLDEDCSIMIMIVTLELITVGMFSEDDTVHDIITQLKRGKIVDVNGKSFVAKNVGMTGVLNGYPIVCNLGCDLYA